MGFRWLGTWPVLDEVNAVEARRARSKEMAVTDRIKIKVRWSRGLKRWRLACVARMAPVLDHVADYPSKRQAVEAATRLGRSLFENRGHLAQVVVLGKSGRIQEERTYGADPVRRRG